MKKVLVFLCLSVISFGYTQTQILEPGIYKSNSKGQQLKLRVFEDNQYEIAVLYGRYTVKNDTISFNNPGPNEAGFKIKINKDAPFSSTFKLKFDTESISFMARNIYVGTQKDDNAVIEYKSLIDYAQKQANRSDLARKKEFKIDVDKTKYLYLTEHNREGNAIVSKFQIDSNVNEIEIKYSGTSNNYIDLRGVLDPETKKISVMERRSQSTVFEFEKEGTLKDTTGEVSPLQVLEEKDWLKNNGLAKDNEFDSSYLESRQTNSYSFKMPVLKTYSEALKSLEKTPEKFLVVVFDNSKNSKTYFSQFIKQKELRLSRSMRDKYNPEKDNFNYYLATEKDKSLLETFKIKDKETILILNANGEMVYHTPGTLEEKSGLFELYYSVFDEVKRANALLKLDKLLKNKKASLADFKKSFNDIIKTKKSYNNYMDEVATDSIAVDSAAVEVVEEDYAAAADTTAVVAYEEDEDNNYYHVEDPENLYSIKAPKAIIAEKWKLILDFYIKQDTYDEDFVMLCKKELINKGFIYKLYGEPKFITDSDFKILDYLFKHYKEILNGEEKQGEDEDEENYYGYSRTNTNLITVLSSFFQTPNNETVPISKAHQIKLVEYYKTYLKTSGYNLNDFSNYLAKIQEAFPYDYSLYFNEYEEFFQSVTAKNTSIIETLDDMFATQKSRYQNWGDFKQTFGRLANNVAWQVVETKNKETATIQRAIKWSETSLKVDKNNYRFWDTLAQLYYKNQEKEKAITTEQKAISLIPAEEKTSLEEYKEVLEQMKNGTY